MKKKLTLTLIGIVFVFSGSFAQTQPVKKDTVLNAPTRKNTVFSRLPVNVKNITLDIFDNGTVDGDSISVYYNNKLLVSNQRLTEKAITVNLLLDDKAPQHEIMLFAHNLGSIPPNTALMIIYDGNKRYEVNIKSTEKTNGSVSFKLRE